MADLGQSEPPSLAPGAAQIAQLQAARKPDGTPAFSSQDIAKYQSDTTQTLLHAGFSVQDVEKHWGISPPNSPQIAAHVANNIRQAGVTEQHGPMAAFEAGWGTSVAGIAQNMATGKNPNAPFQVKPDPGLLNGLALAAGQQAGDLASGILGYYVGMVAGAAVGGAGGAAVPGAGETGVSEAGGAAAGGIVGAVAGAVGMGIASQGTREILLDAYNRGQIKNVGDFLHVIGASAIRTLKAGAESAPFGLAGPIGGKLAEAGAGKVASTVLGHGAAISAGVTTGAALNGHMPDANDFVTAAAMMVAFHGAAKAGEVVHGVFKPSPATLAAQSNLEAIYRRNGTTPWDAINQAKANPSLAQEIVQQDVNGDSVAPRTHANAPPEPPPIAHGAGEAEPGAMRNVTPPKANAPTPPKPAPVVKTFEDLSTALEGSRDASVSPAGAIGKHQIMIGTARQYGFGEGMSDSELVQKLHDPEFNAQVFGKIATDLHARFHGDMNAMLIAYNAGPGRAGEYMTKGPGTELVAIPDKTARDGIRYESEPSQRDESWLPMETQKYLANGRRRSGGETEDTGGSKEVMKIPSWENQAPKPEEAAGGGEGGGPPALPPIEGEEPPGPGEPGGKGFWQRADDDSLINETLANIGEPPKPPSLIDPDRLMEQYVSELTPARNIDTGLVREGGFNRDVDLGQEDMFRQTYASDTRTGAFVRFGILRVEGGRIEVVKDSPSMMTAVDQVKDAGGTMDGWKAYMLNKRTLDKAEQGIETGFNPKVAEEMASRKSFKKYEAATQTFNRVMDGGLEYGRDSGLFSQDQIERMQRDNPTYISMRRIMGDDESFGTGRKGFAARDPLRLMEGSDRQIVDPIYSTIDNLRVIIAMADRNRAVGSIIGQVEMGKLQGLGLEKLPFRPNEMLAEPGSDIFKPYGLSDDSDPGKTYESLLAERSQKGLSPNEFIYYRNGIPERWSAKNPALVTLMRKSVGPGEANIIGKVFDTIASLDRAGVVLDPAFPTRVTLRHQVTAFIADPLHPPPFLTWMSGIHDVLTKSGVFQDWIANGGAGTALADMDVKWLQRDMEDVFQDQGVFSRMWNRVSHPLEAYQWMSERIDAAARVGYYKQALDAGREPLKAATMSRKAMLDYAERASLDGVNSIARKVPFLRPKILGIKMFAENFADRPASTAAYGAAGILGFTLAAVTVPTLALYAANYFADKSLPDDEKYSAIPRWIRDTHYVTPPIAGARIQFPYPFVVGTVFGGLVNRFLDSWVKSDPHAFDSWASSILSDYNPFNMMPAAIKTPIEAVANYNFMSGKPIVPSSVEAADGYMQYTNATTEPAKALSRWLGKPGLNLANFSPMQTEHWIDGWTGLLGIGILKAVNGTMTDYKPPMQMADIPLVGTFFVRNPGMHAQQIEDFYTDLKGMEAAHADWSLALKHGDEGEIATAAKGPFYGLRIVGKIAAALKIQSAAVAAVNTDKTLLPAEKSQAVDQIMNSMIQLSTMGSGITATMQGKEPSQAFKDLDKQGAMTTALATQ